MNFARPDVARIAGYVPGEQPQETGWIKLNTNENPYPCSPRVIEALGAAIHGRLNIYPDPHGTSFRKAAANVHGVDPDWILPANGSDENLTILLRTFVDPGELVAFPYPSYILYETLADLQGAKHVRLPLRADWSFDEEKSKDIAARSKLVLIPNPNSPSGTFWTHDELTKLVPPEGLLVLDGAYGDFADQPDRGELLTTELNRQLVMTHSFSKAYSLAGIRFGYAVAHPDLIAEMRKVKDSYNCDALSLAAATAAITDQEWMQQNAAKIRASRKRLTASLTELGFDVAPGQANFVWATLPSGEHQKTYEALKQRKILIRYMKFPDVSYTPDKLFDGLRITIGTDAELDALLAALKEIV
ncbi:MAG: histidinol-phosphate transaminase [Planctomycetota bacterium]|nr:histidinol-phosphate transaminase [Planctomycetota bacterium]MDA1212568.1 histidinol-phosphate transaminase [Planctomycetota bacterium]